MEWSYRSTRLHERSTTEMSSIFGHHNAPSRRTMVRLINKCEVNESVPTYKTPIRVRAPRSNENIAAVSKSIDHKISISQSLSSL